MPISQFERVAGWNEDDFNPFLGMKRLRKPQYPWEIGRSRDFRLRDIGKGCVILTTNTEVISDNVYFIDTSQRTPGIRLLSAVYGVLSVSFFEFNPGIQVQPDFATIIRSGPDTAKSFNDHAGYPIEDNASFYHFSINGNIPDYLAAPTSLKGLKRLKFRFERLISSASS